MRFLLALALLLPGGAWAARTAPRPSVVYPEAPSAVRFSHRAHAGQDCLACHAGVTSSARAADRNLPPEAACAGCHAPGPETGGRPAGCGTCHTDTIALGPAALGAPDLGPGARRAVPAPPAALHFGHAPHLARGIPCERCHGDVARDDGRGRASHLPSMDVCTDCHDGAAAPARCDTCHPARPDGRLRTDLPAGPLAPTGRVGGLLDHRGDVVRRHGPAAKVDREGCLNCHTEPDCARCHAGTLRPVEIHPADYILTHPAQARRDDPSCGDCHRLQTFCVDCHVRSGVGTVPGQPGFFDGRGTPTSRRFHPPGWVDYQGGPPGPTHHRWEARRNLRTCVGCHEESTCVRCHSTSATARLRASPHPPGFRRHCGRARAVNERGCLQCHGSREALDRACAP